MSTRDLVEALQIAYAAYNEGSAEPFFDLFADDGVIRFVAPPEVYPFAAPRRGPDGAREAIGLIVEDYEWLSYRNLEIVAEGETVIALNGGRLRHRGSGRETVIHLADLVRFRDAQIVEFVEFFDSAGLLDWGEGRGHPACAYQNAGNRVAHTGAFLPAENKAAISNAFAAYRKLDLTPLLNLMADDASYNTVASLADFRFAGPVIGREEVAENIGRIGEDYALEKYDLVEIIAQDDLVAVHADVSFRHRGVDRLVTTEKVDLFRMQGGRVLEFNEFFDSLGARRVHQEA